MNAEHPNIAVLKRFDPRNFADTADVLAEDVVFHFFNPRLPDIQGDYVGRAEVQGFFETLAKQTDGTFEVHPVFVAAAGDELLVTQTRNTMTMNGQRIETDVVLVWRILDNQITEVWDIPSVHTALVTPA